MEKPVFQKQDRPVISPRQGCEWAEKMVLNPAVIQDPENNDLHMLFRATGPCDRKKLAPDSASPYPIFLGYAVSHDGGRSWDADFSRPALEPNLEYGQEMLWIRDRRGEMVPNLANGCIEDPRLFWLEGKLYMTVAGRVFPPGPYWDAMDAEWETRVAMTNRPQWSRSPDNPFGAAAYTNKTSTVLYEVDLDALKRRAYDEAFTYVCPLTDAGVCDNRDVFLFSRKIRIGEKERYFMLHRPEHPEVFAPSLTEKRPSVFLAYADRLEDFVTERAVHSYLCGPLFDWEQTKVGASYPPVELGGGQWLVSCHGVQWPGCGYSQSFFILEETGEGVPVIRHRCPDRMLTPTLPWEMPDTFPCPCVFATAGIVYGAEFLVAYGAADQYVGIARCGFSELTGYVRTFDEDGKV